MQVQIAVIDYGSQYSQLIIRRLREAGYFAKLYQPEELREAGKPSAVILSGGPRSTTEADAPDIDFDYLRGLDVPVLGVCYGMQLLNRKFGGDVKPGRTKEYGPALLTPLSGNGLMEGIHEGSKIWMSHSDSVDNLADGCVVLARNQEDCPVALQWSENFFGLQFHPEVAHTEQGGLVLHNFLKLVGDKPRFGMESFKDDLIVRIQESVAGREVVCGVSGGVDSTVLAVLLKEAEVKMHPILVDTGMLRMHEAEEVVQQFLNLGIEIDMVDASDRFLNALAGVEHPETKREIIGNMFLEVFFDHAGDVEVLAQGTLYPDVIESASSGSIASKIKTHHNRVERVLELQKEGRVIEPLAELFKDEVRALGKILCIPHDVLWRHPFPGPGLAVRCPGEVTRDRLKTIREADVIFIAELKESGWYDRTWQAYAGLIPVKTVGVKGDERSYEFAVNLRAVTSTDAMTAHWVELPYEVLAKVSNRILNEVPGVNRVLYDISTKPPASIEWE